MRPIDADEIKDDFSEILEHDYEDDYARGFQAALVAVLGYKAIAAPPNDPLTLEELREMDGMPVWIDNGYGRNKCYIVNNRYEIHGDVEPCGVDLWGAGTSLSLLVRCGVYRRPPNKEEGA